MHSKMLEDVQASTEVRACGSLWPSQEMQNGRTISSPVEIGTGIMMHSDERNATRRLGENSLGSNDRNVTREGEAGAGQAGWDDRSGNIRSCMHWIGLNIVELLDPRDRAC